MESVKIKNSELEQLQNEVESISKELLTQKKFLPKYHLGNLVTLLTPYWKNLNDSRTELIKKYGTENEKGEASVKKFVDGTEPVEHPEEGRPIPELTEEFKSFAKDFQEILDVELDINVTFIPLSAFEQVETEQFYPVLYKFIK